jgi:hypothetical protein
MISAHFAFDTASVVGRFAMQGSSPVQVPGEGKLRILTKAIAD